MPLALSHKPFLQGPVLQVANEVAIASLSGLPSLLRSAASPSRICGIWHSIGRWRVVGRAGLETDRLRGIEMARYSLNGYGNSTLLHFHRRGSLSSRSHSGLRI